HCHSALGMESGTIPDSDITSSSSHDSSSVGPHMARIRTELEGGAWCPDKQIGPGIYEYIQITLSQLNYITMVETQGRFGNGQGKEYTEWYQVQYQRTDNEEWLTYRTKNNKTVLNGNINTYLAEKRLMTSPILAKRVRFVPYSTRWRTICMRVELYGCPFYGGVVAYSAPPGTRFTDVKLEDDTYDGTRSNALWFGGIGKLVDGQIGEINVSNKQLSSGWIGWNRHQIGSFIVLQFYFDVSRHFKSINIYSHSQSSSLPYQSIHITMYKLSNDLQESNDFVQWTHVPSSSSSLKKEGITIDTIMCKTTVPLASKIDLKFQLTDDNDWLFLTEITFDNSINTITTAIKNLTSLCKDACVSVISNNQTNSLQQSSSAKPTTLFGIEWIALVSCGIIVCFILLILLTFLRFYLLNRKSYCKSQQVQRSTLKELEALTENQAINTYDDVSSDIITLPSSIKTQSMGSYIYPITSTTSVGSHFLSSQNNSPKENYAVIDTYCFNQHNGSGDGRTTTSSSSDNSNTQQTSFYSDWSKLNLNNNSTFHYASSDITQEFLTDDLFPNIQGLFGTNLFHTSDNTYFNRISRQIQSNVNENKLYGLKKISESVNGEIYIGKYDDECTNNINKSVLIKIVKSTSAIACRHSFINEFNILSTLSHPNIIRLCGVQNEHMYLIQEHGDFGTLQDYYRTLTTTLATNDQSMQTMNYCFAYQLSSGLDYLYHCGIVHGDIATRNCLFYQDYTIKLSDHAMVLEKYSNEYWQYKNKKIPLRWMPSDAMVCSSLKSDVYSFGVCLWEIWNRCHLLPHSSLSNYELYLKLCQINKQSTNELKSLNLPLPPDCPKEIYDLLCECWNYEQDKRPQISDICIYFRRQIDGCIM
ncbi:unnamed protein product, partial [Didymodactylos carnosus]